MGRRKLGRRPRPGQRGLGILPLVQPRPTVRPVIRITREMPPWVVFDSDGKIARKNPIEAWTGKQAIGGFRDIHPGVYLGKKPSGIRMSELIPGFQPGMNLAQAKGLKPFDPAAVKWRLRFVVFDKTGKVVAGHQPIWAYSKEAALTGFSHTKNRLVDPGEKANAIPLEDIAGDAERADNFPFAMIVAGMTEQVLCALVIKMCIRTPVLPRANVTGFVLTTAPPS